MIGVYSITSPSGKIYVGSSKTIEKRWRRYNNLDCKKQSKLYNSFLKYGVSNHIFKVLIECEVDSLYEWEHHYSNYYNTINDGLNCCIPRFGDVIGLVSKETRIKISEVGKGRKFSDEHKRKISHANKGVKKSAEHVEKSRSSNIGRKHTLEHIEKNRQSHLGTKRSDETRAKMREANKKAKIVIDITTGVFYYSAKEASISMNINYGTLRDYLINHRPNKTNLRYAV